MTIAASVLRGRPGDRLVLHGHRLGEPECGGHCHHTKEYGFVPEAGCPVHDAPIADRASRRLAYVRKHAARFLRAYIRAGYSADLSRANAIEQAGLIFDETEQSDG